MAAFLGVTDRAYLRPLSEVCNDQIQYGHIDEATGYLRILSFSNYVKEAASRRAWRRSKRRSTTSSPIARSGARDRRADQRRRRRSFGLAIASRLATREYLAYTKEARADPIDRNRWTPGIPAWSGRVPAPLSRTNRRVDRTAHDHAGETFTQALMGRTPPITRIGENTQVSSPTSWVDGFRMGGASACRTRCSGRRRGQRSTGRAFRRTWLCPCSRMRTWPPERTPEWPGRWRSSARSSQAYIITPHMVTSLLERELKRGSTEVLILALLDERQRHGYDISQLIEQRSNGTITFHTASLYPTLYRLEDKG